MSKVDEGVIGFAVYEDGTEYYGMASVQLPELGITGIEIAGGGMSGKFNAPIMGQMDAMSLTLNFRTVTEAAIRLAEPRNHQIDLRVAQQRRDTVSGIIKEVPVKHLLVITPVKLNPGKAEPAAAADVSGEYSCSYFATFIDGRKVLEIDIFNYIYFVNGKDYLAGTRKALGK